MNINEFLDDIMISA